jgi:hypothetical protein
MNWENRYTAYFDFCKNLKSFDNFKTHSDCTGMLEHVNYELGRGYISEIKKHYPYLLDDIKVFATNDKIGNPTTHYYDEIGIEISPSTLRYVKVLGDLINLCGPLTGKDIIEIGGGYGGQCKIIHDVFEPKSYTIIDHPNVMILIYKYLKQFNIKLQSKREMFDLFISNYAFTEIDRKFQDSYRKYIDNSKKGYMTCNWFGIRPDDGMKKEEIEKLRDGHFIPEVPLTGHNNCIYIWE